MGEDIEKRFARKRRENYRANLSIVILYIVAFVTLVLGIYYVDLSKNDLSGEQANLYRFSFGTVVLISIGLALRIDAKRKRLSSGERQYVVLWLRGFERRKRGFFSANRLVKSASRFVATPLTLRDGSFSHDRKATDWIFENTVGLLAIVFCYFAVWQTAMIFLSDRHTPIPYGMTEHEYSIQVFVWSSLILTVVLPIATFWIGRWFGFKRLSKENFLLRLRRVVIEAKEDTQRARVGTPIILQCEDEIWQVAVLRAMELCDAVIIDVTKLTENVRWELERAVETVGPSRMVLLKARWRTNPGEFWRNVHDVIGVEALDEAQKFVYSGRFSLLLRKSSIRGLREEVMRALA